MVVYPTAALDDVLRLTRGARDAVWLSQLADRLIILDIIDEILDIDLGVEEQPPSSTWDRDTTEK